MSKIYCINIEKETLLNSYYRKVLATTDHQQLVVMSLKAKEDIPMEIHPKVDQFIRIEKGNGKAIIGKDKKEEYELPENTIIMIPAGTYHQIINVSDTDDLKLYTIYSPPNHAPNKIDIIKPPEVLPDRENFKYKYLKYKDKYLGLKNQLN